MLKKLAIFAISMVVSVTAQAAKEEKNDAAYEALKEKSHMSTTKISERTAPVGKVYLPGDDVPVAEPVVAASSGPKSPEDIYNASCSACHGAGIAGAPKVGDTAAWADRIAKGLDALKNSGINGVAGSAMAAKGGCASCTDEEIMSVVEFMVSKSQ